MVLNHLLFIVLLYHSLLILVLTKNFIPGFRHPDCSPQIRYDPIYIPHLTDCRKFYECDLGLAYEFLCPSEMHFNVYINGCDTPEDALCRNRTDHRKIHKETTEQPKHIVTTELKDLSTTKTSMTMPTLQTSQDGNSVNRTTATEARNTSTTVKYVDNHPKILIGFNVNPQSSRRKSKPSRFKERTTFSIPNPQDIRSVQTTTKIITYHSKTPNGSKVYSTARTDSWSKFTKQANIKENSFVQNNFSFTSATKQVEATEQQSNTPWSKRHKLVASTRPSHETVSGTTRSTYKKNKFYFKQKDIDHGMQRNKNRIPSGETDHLKKTVYFGTNANNGTIGENSVLNKPWMKLKKQ